MSKSEKKKKEPGVPVVMALVLNSWHLRACDQGWEPPGAGRGARQGIPPPALLQGSRGLYPQSMDLEGVTRRTF